jgi:hypothetical protein
VTLPGPTTPLALAALLATAFSQFPHVEAVALGGSQASGRGDAASDIDLYVFTTATIPLDHRKTLMEKRGASRTDLDLRFWDLGDEWVDADSGIEVDIIYWDTAWIEEQIAHVLDRHQASLGYTTSFWHTIRAARLLYDRGGWLGALQAKASQPYPEDLRNAILLLNHPVLRRVIPAYSHQIELAVQRGDLVSVNHRVAAFLASYFDILFALNRELNPGEKRLLSITPDRCAKTPSGMTEDLTALLRACADPGPDLPARLHRIIDRLDQLLLAEGFDPSTAKPFEPLNRAGS